MQQPIEQYWRIGHTVFTPKICKRNRRKLLDKYEEIFSSKDWNFDYFFLEQKLIDDPDEWNLIFSCIHETSNEMLRIKDLQLPQLLMDICYPNYSKLMNLYLKRCIITNIEFLTFLNAENMISIDLISNEINSVKPFNKLKWNHLSFIYLCDNPINEIEISRARMKVQMNTIKLEQQGDNWVMGMNMNFVVKLPFKNYGKVMNLELDYEGSRVKQDRVVESIKRKYPKIKIKQVQILRLYQAHLFRRMMINQFNSV